MRLFLVVAVLVGFSAYTLGVMWSHGGVLGFLELAGREPWGLQVFLDLCLMLTLFGAWLWRDARTHGLSPWPYLALLSLGSPGALISLVRRELAVRGAKRSAA
ncbi:MAG: hypothetical protein K1X89_04030 [Myxococcaceae bacterium]|nr:hypothetical protein [Myxococcaceae bacterium]